MKRRHIVIIITCLILVVAGICYSCTYKGAKNLAPPITTLSKASNTSGDVAEGLDLSENPQISSEGLGEFSVDTKETEPPLEVVQGSSLNSSETKKDIYVHLCGAVQEPKVYQVKEGTRLVELIHLAGGLADIAAGDYINQAVQVQDGQRIYIPTKEEVEKLDARSFITGGAGDTPESIGTKENKLININEADAALLMTLPGIGQAKADGILEYRKTKGKFKTREELMNVPGIKEGMYSKISPYITVE